MGDLMLRPLLDDVADEDMCGVAVDQVPANDTWHPLLMQAITAIPDVRTGDSVWWHCDMIHSVAPVKDLLTWEPRVPVRASLSGPGPPGRAWLEEHGCDTGCARS